MEHLFAGKETIESKTLTRAYGHKVEINIRALTGPEHAEYQDLISSKMKVGKGTTIDIKSAKMIRARNFVVKKGVMGWSGIKDESGDDILCNEENVLRLLKSPVPRDVSADIASAIINLTNTGSAEEIDEDGEVDYENVGGRESSMT